MEFITLTQGNIEREHICCAISDKKHAPGVEAKKRWLRERIAEGHVFRKLDARGKVFIEYAPLESAWTPVEGAGYVYIYCLWVAGSFKGEGHGKALLEGCIEDAKSQGKAGVCVISSKKKKPYTADGKFFRHFGFETADTAGEFELLALPFSEALPHFTQNAKRMEIPDKTLTIYYGCQCPFIADCVVQLKEYCDNEGLPLKLIEVDTLEKAKALPCAFNNWAVFSDGHFVTNQLLNVGALKKLLGR